MKHGQLRAALIKIAVRAVEEGAPFPGHADVARELGCHVSSVGPSLLSLRADRVVQMDGRMVREVRV